MENARENTFRLQIRYEEFTKKNNLKNRKITSMTGIRLPSPKPKLNEGKLSVSIIDIKFKSQFKQNFAFEKALALSI